MNGLAPGNSASDRIGMKVTIKTIEFKYNIRSGVNQTASVWNRVLIVIDRQANGTAPLSVNEILMAQSHVAPRNLANRKRFKIIYDKTLTTDPQITNQGGVLQRFQKGYIKFRRPLVTEYNTGIAGNVADISTNSMYLIYFGEQAAGAQNSTLTGFWRIRYTDM